MLIYQETLERDVSLSLMAQEKEAPSWYSLSEYNSFEHCQKLTYLKQNLLVQIKAHQKFTAILINIKLYVWLRYHVNIFIGSFWQRTVMYLSPSLCLPAIFPIGK